MSDDQGNMTMGDDQGNMTMAQLSTKVSQITLQIDAILEAMTLSDEAKQKIKLLVTGGRRRRRSRRGKRPRKSRRSRRH